MEVKWNKHVVILYDKDKDKPVADALKFYIQQEFKPCDVILVDHDEYTNSLIRKAQDAAKWFVVRHARKILRVYSEKREAKALQNIKEQNKAKYVNATEKESKDAEVNRVLNVFKRFDPVMVICTPPYALNLALRAKNLYGKPVGVVGAATDFSLNPEFVRLDADGYFVENPEIKQSLVKYGVDMERISVIGMPSLKIENGMTVEDKRHLLGISDDLPVVVVNGGDYATGTIREDIELLMRKKENYNLVIITSNKTLRRHYMELPDFKAGVLINDKLDDNILDVADILVTLPQSKPIFAAFMRGVSVVVTKAVTKHEHETRRYLVKRALVIPSRTPRETLFAVEELLVDVERRQEFSKRGVNYAAMSLSDIVNVAPQLTAEMNLRIEGGSDDPQ